MKAWWTAGALLVVSIFSVFPEKVSLYVPEKIGTIKSGTAEGCIGWRLPMGGGAETHPHSFAISPDDVIYVPDAINQRISLFDLSLNPMRTIYEKEGTHCIFAERLLFGPNGMLVSISGRGVDAIDANGKRLFSIPRQALPPSAMSQGKFFLIEDKIFFYDEMGKVHYLDARGVEYYPQAAAKVLQGYSLHGSYSKEELRVFDVLLGTWSFILVGDRFYSADFYQSRAYFDLITKVRDGGFAQRSLPKRKVDIDINGYTYWFGLIGFDKDHNAYWDASPSHPLADGTQKSLIAVFNMYGSLIDAFFYGEHRNSYPIFSNYDTSGALVAVSRAGNVYFLVDGKDEYTVYMIRRAW